MESNEDVFSPVRRSVENNQPVAMVSQLMHDIAGMNHIDEVFLWLSRQLVRRLDVHTVQIWVVQKYSAGQPQPELRSFASLKPALSQSLLADAQIVAVAERMFREKHGSEPLPIAHIFASYQAKMLTKQNIYYWAGYYLHHADLLLPVKSTAGPGQTPTPLSLAASIFMEKQPSPRLLRSIQFIFEQAIRIAISRGFLSVTAYKTPKVLAEEGVKPNYQAFLELIPHRLQELQAEHGTNPFASAMTILDKKPRTFYFAIDGRKNVHEVARLEHLEQKDLPGILQILIGQKYIQLYEPGGKVVANSFILKSL